MELPKESLFNVYFDLDLNQFNKFDFKKTISNWEKKSNNTAYIYYPTIEYSSVKYYSEIFLFYKQSIVLNGPKSNLKLNNFYYYFFFL